MNVNEIFWNITTGEWNNVIGKSVGADNKIGPDSIAFTQDLFDELTWKYNQIQQKKLN
jgi:hypothetical protein